METDRDLGEPFRLLFVCTGNTCRSPMAEAIARRSAARRGWRAFEVRSAGVAAVDGGPPSEGAERAARRHGIQLAGHRSSALTPEALGWADLVLAMSPGHLVQVREVGGGAKASLITAFARGEEGSGGGAVPDPFGGSDDEYEATFTMLEELVERCLDRLAPLIAP